MERKDFIEKNFFNLNEKELYFAREECFLGDYKFLSRHLVLNTEEVIAEPTNLLSNNYFTDELPLLREEFRKAGNKQKIFELLKQLVLKLNELTYKVFSTDDQDCFSEYLLRSFSSIYLIYDYAIRQSLQYFDSNNDLI